MSETPDQKRTRRRWINLAELVAVAGLLIGALSLWLSWSEKRGTEADRAAIAAKESKAERTVRLEDTVADGGDTLRLADATHKIETVDLLFPAALGVAAHAGVPEPRIEAGWVREALLKATDGGADDQEGRLPVLVTAHWWDADARRSDRAIYDVVWRTHGRLGRGRALELTGLVLRERDGSAKRLNALWHAPKR